MGNRSLYYVETRKSGAVVVPNTDLVVGPTDAVHTDAVSVLVDFQAVIHLASFPTL